MTFSSPVRIKAILVAALLAAVLVAIILLGEPRGAAAAAVEQQIAHVGQVPETPRSNFPVIINGEVRDVAANEHFVVAVGSFTQVEDKDGTVIDQPYAVAFDIDSGELITTFRPQIDGPLAAVAFGVASNEVFLGGEFETVNGIARNNIALVDLATGDVEPFVANTAGRVSEIVVADSNRMFIGGAFGFVNGTPIDRIVEVHPVTGAINTSFNFTFTGEAGRRAAGQNIRFLGLTPNNDKLVAVHTAAEIDGEAKRGAAVFDISDPNNPQMTPFSANGYSDGLRYSTYAPSEGAISPDGSFFMLVTTGHVMAFDVNGGAESPRLWETDHQDSVFSTTVSNNAVYTGGHFCKIAGGPDETDLIGGGFTDRECSGTDPNQYDQDTAAFRYQMAALKPSNGTPLSWDPGTDVAKGILSLEATPRGLLAGGDGTYVGGIRTGRFAFFDMGAGSIDQTGPTSEIASPLDVPGPAVTLSGTASDNSRLRSVKLRIRNAAGEYLQADGSFGATVFQTKITPGFVEPGAPFSWSSDLTLADGTYVVLSRATDMAFNTTGWVQQTLTVRPEPEPCSVALVGGQPVASWLAVPGEDEYSVRRDGKFVSSVAALSFVDTAATAGEHSYVVRSRVGGVVTNTDCGSVTVPAVASQCSVALVGGQPVASWLAVPGEDEYSVRRDGKFVSSVAALSFVDTAATAGEHSYVVRSRVGGVVTNTNCGSVTVP